LSHTSIVRFVISYATDKLYHNEVVLSTHFLKKVLFLIKVFKGVNLF